MLLNMIYRIFVRHEETEDGANSEWIPGGKTSGGTTEAVLVGSDKVIHNGKWNTFISFFDNVELIK